MPWAAIAPALLAGAGSSFLVEQLLQPGVLPFWRRPLAASALHLGVWLLAFAFELILFRRPWFAISNILAVLLIMVLVSNAKFQTLREPFIFQDFEYFTDTLKHPRLYLPFFGLKKALLAALGYGAALSAGLTFEPSLTGNGSGSEFFLMVAVLAIAGTALLWAGSKGKLPVDLNPEADLLQLGLVASLWRYGGMEREACPVSTFRHFTRPAAKIPEPLPNLVVVQSESFFDVRTLFSGIRPEILNQFDSLKSSSLCHGKLAVPAWGANTVRSEFAFLSGMSPEELGIHRFNPYRKLARKTLPTMVSLLKGLGYRTVCVHPYPASFYNRNTVFPQLGFDEFLDIDSFDGVKKTGPYIGDVDLAEKVCALLKNSAPQPVFVFVITMENHGPLHWEKVEEGEAERYYTNPPSETCADLTIYLRHLANGDRMARMVRACLESLPGSGWLCWFGDHVPIMPEVYAEMGAPDGRTDYLIWRKGGAPGNGTCRDMKVEHLACRLLTEMGLITPGEKQPS